MDNFDFKGYFSAKLKKAGVEDGLVGELAQKAVVIYNTTFVEVFASQLMGEAKKVFIDGYQKTTGMGDLLNLIEKYPDVDRKLVEERSMTKALTKIEELLKSKLTEEQLTNFFSD